MKTRAGFVSNSSSASFVIKMDDLSEAQIDMIQNHIYFARKAKGRKRNADISGLRWARDENAWMISIDEERNEIRGYTVIDNFDMSAFLEYIGVDLSQVEFNRH